MGGGCYEYMEKMEDAFLRLTPSGNGGECGYHCAGHILLDPYLFEFSNGFNHASSPEK